MSIYIVVDDEEELEDMKVFSNRTEAENYMVITSSKNMIQ